MSMDEATLLTALRAGKQHAYTQLVKQYHGALVSSAGLMVGQQHAEEVVQETWLAVIKSLPRFEGRSSLKTWIYAILSNHAKDRLRKDMQMKTESLHAQDDDGELIQIEQRFDDRGHWLYGPHLWHSDSPEALLSKEQLQDCLQKVTGLLPDAQRIAMTLRDAQGFALEEICNILEVSETNVRVLLHRARTRLWLMIENYEQGKGC
jgi:RNA polymerase sigma-70 factor (ECF subfamily)